MTVGKLCHVLRDYEVIQSSLSNVAKNENEADNSAEKDFRFGQCDCTRYTMQVSRTVMRK